MKPIHLPCLRGNFGEWTYFSTVFPIKDIVENKRIITVGESKELYTQAINDILQRDVDKKRINKIRDYLLRNKERFFSSLVVAIHGGNPEWADFDIEPHFRIDNRLLDETEVKFIENKLGVLTLSGNEEIFVLDGQHRLLGIREAAKKDENIKKDEISTIIIVHNQDIKERTRRLFTVLNRYAEKIKSAEKIILEEDDAAAILTRKLVTEYPFFLNKFALADVKAFSIPATNFQSFTTLVCLYEINKILIDYNKLYPDKVISRRNEDEMNDMWIKILAFWDFFLATFPDLKTYIETGFKPNDSFRERNPSTGGHFLLRPEGQLIFAGIYSEFSRINKFDYLKDNVNKIDFDLSGKLWKYVFWTGTKIESKNKKLKRSLFNYVLNNFDNEDYIMSEMKKIYSDKKEVFDENMIRSQKIK